jgi:hypothetical protein
MASIHLRSAAYRMNTVHSQRIAENAASQLPSNHLKPTEKHMHKINPETLRDHALVAAAAEKLVVAKSNLDAARAALAKAVAECTAATGEHRAEILRAAPGAADTKVSADSHQRAVSAIALAESFVIDLELELERAQQCYAHAVAESWRPVQQRGRELRLAAVRAGAQAAAAIHEARELYQQGTALIDRSFSGGMARPMGGIPGLILTGPGLPLRLPTEGEEISTQIPLGGAL